MKRIKLRYKTWYWGKYVLEGDKLDGSIITRDTDGFELYDEDQHGWHNSEEYQNEQR